jgi:hypothetical protein
LYCSEKDPGIPNSWPYKEQEIAEFEQQRQKMQEEKVRTIAL